MLHESQLALSYAVAHANFPYHRAVPITNSVPRSRSLTSHHCKARLLSHAHLIGLLYHLTLLARLKAGVESEDTAVRIARTALTAVTGGPIVGVQVEIRRIPVSIDGSDAGSTHSVGEVAALAHRRGLWRDGSLNKNSSQ